MKWTAERILANSDFKILLSWMFFPYLSYTCPIWTYFNHSKIHFYCTIIPLLVHIVLCNVLFFSEVCRKKNFYKRLFLLVSHRTIMLLSGLRINLLALLHSAVGTEYNFWTIKYAIYLLNWAFFATTSFLVKFVKKVCVLHTYNNEHFFSWKQSIKVQV